MIIRFLENIVETLEKFAGRIEFLVGKMFEGVLNFLESARDWAIRIARRIGDYLVRFFRVIVELLVALVKLSLFYIPSVIFILIGYVQGSSGWYLAGVIWGLLVTGIGLTYSDRNRGSNGRSVESDDTNNIE